MRKLILLPAILLSGGAFAQNSDSKFSESIRKNASSFHKNFSTGDFDKNGLLVDEKIYVNSNNVIVIGRDKFVERIKRYHTPFPTLKLVDKIIIVDENEAGLLYALQGTQDGPYGDIPASGNKVNVYSAEFFTMNDDSKMKELLTITQLDLLKKQLQGEIPVENYDKITLLANKSTSLDHKKKLKNNIDSFVQDVNARDWKAFENLFANDAEIIVNGKKLKNKAEFTEHIKSYIKHVPDMTYHLLKNVVEGDRGALAYEVNGSYKKQANGNEMTFKLADVKQGIHFQFNSKGEIISAIIVYNSDDINNQLK